MRLQTAIVWGLAVLIQTTGSARAAVLYVNNVSGSPANNGLAADSETAGVGPVASINHALRLATRADTIVVSNTGVPYYESLSIAGENNSGYPNARFVIEGNGALVSGARQIPPEAFRNVQGDLFRIQPFRKGHYLLLRDGAVVPEVQGLTDSSQLDRIQPGQWGVLGGYIYYHLRTRENLADQVYGIAYEPAGMTFYGVHDVEVRNLQFQHYRLDGVNAHDQVLNVELTNVAMRENGRSGISVNGISRLKAVGCTVERNRLDSIRITELGTIELEDCQIDAPVNVIEGR